jgi:Ni/Co efflux regulator RcnB
MQIPPCVYSEISQDSVVWCPALTNGGAAKAADAAREMDRRRHLMRDHLHMLVSIPPKYSVLRVVGYLKGKGAILIARTYMGKPRNFTSESFWARGYFVSTVEREEKQIREYKEANLEAQRIDHSRYQPVATLSGPQHRPLRADRKIKPPALAEVF